MKIILIRQPEKRRFPQYILSVVAAKFIIIPVFYRKDLPKNLGEKGRNFVPFRLTCVAQKLKTPSYFLHTHPHLPPPFPHRRACPLLYVGCALAFAKK